MQRNLNGLANYGLQSGPVQNGNHGHFNYLGQNYGTFNIPGQNVNYVQFNYQNQNNNFAQVNGTAMVGSYGQQPPPVLTYGYQPAQFLPSGPPQVVTYGQPTGQSNLQIAYGR